MQLVNNFYLQITELINFLPGLANSDDAHASGLMLKLSILLDYDSNSDIIPRGKVVHLCKTSEWVGLSSGLYVSLNIYL